MLVFTIYKAMVLRGIDGKNASEIVDITMVEKKHSDANPYFSYPDYSWPYRDGLRSFNGLIAYRPSHRDPVGCGVAR